MSVQCKCKAQRQKHNKNGNIGDIAYNPFDLIILHFSFQFIPELVHSFIRLSDEVSNLHYNEIDTALRQWFSCHKMFYTKMHKIITSLEVKLYALKKEMHTHSLLFISCEFNVCLSLNSSYYTLYSHHLNYTSLM